MTETKINPRATPDRDSRYMGLSWMYASFSKDPSTQVGSCIVNSKNKLIGIGYNGPPRSIDDLSFSWDRPSKENPDEFSKYDVIVHAEINAIKYADHAVVGSTLYVTAMPCPKCMLEIVKEEIDRVIYYDYQSSKNSSLQNSCWRDKSIKIAQMGKIRLEMFQGNLNWINDWTHKIRDLGIFA